MTGVVVVVVVVRLRRRERFWADAMLRERETGIGEDAALARLRVSNSGPDVPLALSRKGSRPVGGMDRSGGSSRQSSKKCIGPGAA